MTDFKLYHTGPLTKQSFPTIHYTLLIDEVDVTFKSVKLPPYLLLFDYVRMATKAEDKGDG